MDASVIRSMARWPNVPQVFGWLSLDRRGIWRLRGVPFKHPNSIAFLNRHYFCDEQGRWFFQNGPQRVFVKLDYTPVIWFPADDEHILRDHTGMKTDQLLGVWLDEDGHCLLQANMPTRCQPASAEKSQKPPRDQQLVGLLVDRDLTALSKAFCDPQGRPLSDEALSSAIEATCAGQPNQLGLRWQRDVLPVSPIESAQVATTFGFDPDPQPTGKEACTPNDLSPPD